METSDVGGKKTEKLKPVMLDRSATGRIRLVIDGQDGRSGIGALARSVESLENVAGKLRGQRDREQQVVDSMKSRMGDFIGALQALFTRAQAALQATEEKLASIENDIREKSKEVCDGIVFGEEIIDEYVKSERKYQAAEQLQEILKKMKLFAGICETVLQSIARLQKSGEVKEMAHARELFARNGSSLQQMAGEYGDQIGKNPRWTRDVGHDFSALIARGSFGEVKKYSDDVSTALNAKMDEYVDEIKRNLPDNLGALLTNEKKEYFKAHASPNRNTGIPENNP